eukprot:139408-Amphidinium_carterae.1
MWSLLHFAIAPRTAAQISPPICVESQIGHCKQDMPCAWPHFTPPLGSLKPPASLSLVAAAPKECKGLKV